MDGVSFSAATETKKGILLDPRTKLVLLLTITTLMFSTGNEGMMNIVKPCLSLVPFVLILSARRFKTAGKYLALYAACFVLERIALTALSGLLSFIMLAITAVMTRFAPGIMTAAYLLFKENYNWNHPIRSLGIRAENLVLADVPVQLDLFISEELREKQEKMDQAVDEIRRRFGYFSIQKAFVYQDKALASLDAQSSHTVHTVGDFNGR